MKAEEVLEKQGFKIMCHQKDDDVLHDVFVKPLIQAMEEYASIKQDELIEKIWDKIRISEGVINENNTVTRLEYESYGKNSLGFREFLKSFK
jgi:hypothetical protein